MRSTLLDSAESMLNALATLPISMSGSRASSMMWVATPGGEGKFTSERRWASISGFTRGHSHCSQDYSPTEGSVRDLHNLRSFDGGRQAGFAPGRHQSRSPLNGGDS